eukprot:10227494-Lingulodinium_polyedra.AAC.1
MRPSKKWEKSSQRPRQAHGTVCAIALAPVGVPFNKNWYRVPGQWKFRCGVCWESLFDEAAKMPNNQELNDW